jgi:antitoxin VapB
MAVDSTSPQRTASLFRNGRNQAVRIPRELELPGDEVLISKDGDRLILEPVARRSRLTEVLANLEPLDEPFPDVDAELLPLDEPKV